MSLNLLLDELPEAVTVSGTAYAFDPDFRAFIIMEKVLDDPELDERQKIDEIIGLFFVGDEVPADKQEAIDAILDMYLCGEKQRPRKPRKNGNVELKEKPIYSFTHDSAMIYAAFLHDYGIDLNAVEYLHWWKFMALFKNLGTDNKIVEVMGYRAADPGKIKDKGERSRIMRMKEIYALPNNMTTEDKIASAGAAFGGGFR